MASAAIGAALRKLRESHGLTQQDLADKTGVSRSHLCQVELGKTWPSQSFLRRCEELLNEPDRLVVLLRDAKVPTQVAEESAHLDVVSHAFVPVCSLIEFKDEPAELIEIDGMFVARYVIDNGESSCDAYVLPFGVTVAHVTEQRRFGNIVQLAQWRRSMHLTVRGWCQSMLQGVSTVAVTEPQYTLSLFEVLAKPWSDADTTTGMRLLSVPSMLLNRPDAESLDMVTNAESHEMQLFRDGFDHSHIIDFGVQGISHGCASWAGVSYYAESPKRALLTPDLVRWEVLVQALWCYCDAIVNNGASVVTDDQYGRKFLRSMSSRLSLASAREHLQRRLMCEAILSTSLLPAMLERAEEVLAEAHMGAEG